MKDNRKDSITIFKGLSREDKKRQLKALKNQKGYKRTYMFQDHTSNLSKSKK